MRRGKLTLEDMKTGLANVKALVAEGDYEAAHSQQMALYEAVLRYVANGPLPPNDDANELARIALKTRSLVTRWS